MSNGLTNERLIAGIDRFLALLDERYKKTDLPDGQLDPVRNELDWTITHFKDFKDALEINKQDQDTYHVNLDPDTLRDEKRVVIREGSEKGQTGHIAHASKQMVHVVYDMGASATYYSNLLDENERTDDARINALHDLAVIGGVW